MFQSTTMKNDCARAKTVWRGSHSGPNPTICFGPPISEPHQILYLHFLRFQLLFWLQAVDFRNKILYKSERDTSVPQFKICHHKFFTSFLSSKKGKLIFHFSLFTSLIVHMFQGIKSINCKQFYETFLMKTDLKNHVKM